MRSMYSLVGAKKPNGPTADAIIGIEKMKFWIVLLSAFTVLLTVRGAFADGFILRAGDGEPVLNGIVVKASPATGTERSILAEQTFDEGGGTNLHRHDQGDELFYVVSGTGVATLEDAEEPIGPGDVIFVPRGAIHMVGNPSSPSPLVVVFFMDSPELVEQFRAIHERRTQNPDQPISPEERAEIESRIGGAIEIN